MDRDICDGTLGIDFERKHLNDLGTTFGDG